MGLKTRLHRMEKLGRLHAPKQRPATVEHTAGQYFVLDPAGRTPIGDASGFQQWMAAGNRAWAIIEGLTPTGSELVRRIVAGERTDRLKEHK